jgi:hypothetical protein
VNLVVECVVIVNLFAGAASAGCGRPATQTAVGIHGTLEIETMGAIT